jgi:hypothetical protein
MVFRESDFDYQFNLHIFETFNERPPPHQPNNDDAMKRIIKTIIIAIIAIIGLGLISRLALSLHGECWTYFCRKAFLAKYEFEDFSQFKNVSVFIRGGDSERNPVIFVNAPRLVRDTSKVGCYVVVIKNMF